MSTTLDLTQSAQSILVQQINKDNNKTFTVEQLTFGPVMMNADADAATYEAVVMVTGVPAQGVAGSFAYKYNRIDLETIFGANNSSYSVDAATDYASFIAAINTAMGLNLQVSQLPNNDTNQLYVPGDIMPASLPTPSPASPSVKCIITADQNSLIYRGAALLNATTSAVSLLSEITVASTGLVYTPPA